MIGFRRATVEESAHSCLQGHIPATYSQLVQAFGEPDSNRGPKVRAYWGICFDDGTFASVYLWKLTSIPRDLHEWNVGGHSDRAVMHVCEVLDNLPPPSVDESDQILPPPPAHPPWTKHNRALNRACAAGDQYAADDGCVKKCSRLAIAEQRQKEAEAHWRLDRILVH